jgi:hypothetical protein
MVTHKNFLTEYFLEVWLFHYHRPSSFFHYITQLVQKSKPTSFNLKCKSLLLTERLVFDEGEYGDVPHRSPEQPYEAVKHPFVLGLLLGGGSLLAHGVRLAS